MASITSSSGNVVLKIQLELGHNQTEHHRKRVDAASLNFARLQAIIDSLLPSFSSIASAEATISYLDGDLDEIRVKGDDDLREAIIVKNEKNSDTLRLTVKVAPDVTPKPKQPEEAHNGCKPRKGHWRNCHQKKRCQWNGGACGFPPCFAMGIGQHNPKALIQEVLAQPVFHAFLRAVADTLEALSARTNFTFNPCSIAKELWRKKECQDLVKWLKSSVPEIAPMLAMLDVMMQQPEKANATGQREESSSSSSSESDPSQAIHYGVRCDGSGQFPLRGRRFQRKGEDYDLCESEFNKLSEEEQKKFVEIKKTFNFADVLQRVNMDDVRQHVGLFQQLFNSSQPCEGISSAIPSGAPDDDPNLQTAIQRSLASNSNHGTLNTDMEAKEGHLAAGQIETSESSSSNPVSNPAVAISIPPVDVRENNKNGDAATMVVEETGQVERGEAEVKAIPFEKEIQILQSMGFYDVEAIRSALRATDETADTRDPSINVQYALQRLFQ